MRGARRPSARLISSLEQPSPPAGGSEFFRLPECEARGCVHGGAVGEAMGNGTGSHVPPVSYRTEVVHVVLRQHFFISVYIMAHPGSLHFSPPPTSPLSLPLSLPNPQFRRPISQDTPAIHRNTQCPQRRPSRAKGKMVLGACCSPHSRRMSWSQEHPIRSSPVDQSIMHWPWIRIHPFAATPLNGWC
jgi:hypothetical protein